MGTGASPVQAERTGVEQLGSSAVCDSIFIYESQDLTLRTMLSDGVAIVGQTLAGGFERYRLFTTVIFFGCGIGLIIMDMALITERKAFIVATVATLLIASYGFAETPHNNPAEVNQSEYDVYSTYIAHYLAGKAAEERIGLSVAQIIIVDTTEYDYPESEGFMPWRAMQKYLRVAVPSLQAATIKNFGKRNTLQASLQQRFSLPLPYELTAQSTLDSILHDIADWPEYYKRYPGAQGFLVLSRIGFSLDGKQALFYTSNHCGGTCATGSFVVAEKHGTKWAVTKEVIVWVP